VSEIFDEVQEEVRREQLKKLWERYAPLIVAVAFLIVAGVGGWRGYLYWESKRAQEAGAQFEAAATLADQHKGAEAEAAFLKIANEAPQGYRMLARFRAAAELGCEPPDRYRTLCRDQGAARAADRAEPHLPPQRA
jgi:hypothetical protein